MVYMTLVLTSIDPIILKTRDWPAVTYLKFDNCQSKPCFSIPTNIIDKN